MVMLTRLEAVTKELKVAKAALSALSGLPDDAAVSVHAGNIAARLERVAVLIARLDDE